MAIVDLPEPERPVIQSVTPFWPSAAKRLSLGRWHASCDAPASASAHSMMFGGVAASRAARYAPMSKLSSVLESISHAVDAALLVRESTYTIASTTARPIQNGMRLFSVLSSSPDGPLDVLVPPFSPSS